MKTQNEMRSKFEKLGDIANLIQEGGAFYCDKDDWYLCQNIDHSAIEMALDVAWYTYQEQQKKIDSVLNLVCKLQYSSGERIYSETKGVLK